MATTPSRVVLGTLIAVVLGTSACTNPTESVEPAGGPSPAADAAGTTVDWTITDCGTFDGEGCAADSDRVDLERPMFSNPTEITNPLFPISALNSVVLLGEVNGLPFRSETTLIPGAHSVIVDGEPIEVLVSQYTAYSDGRIEEVAIDRYAQADDGSVWYLGEDVFDYRDGTVAITEGSWLAGRDGPPAMIMPADPQVGDAFRSENVTGVVFEELTVTEVDQTVDGPRGPVTGAVTMEELHLDGSVSDKIFAPGYGEFDSSDGEDVEALAVAVPADTIDEVVPTELRLLSTSAFGILENARLEDWEAATPTLKRIEDVWRELDVKDYPSRIVEAMDDAVSGLSVSVAAEDVAGTSQAGVDVGQSALDLELLYRGFVETDRFHIHAQQLRVHAAAGDLAGVTGEVAVLEWVRDRLTTSVSEPRLAGLDAELDALRGATDAGNLLAAADHAARAAAALRG